MLQLRIASTPVVWRGSQSGPEFCGYFGICSWFAHRRGAVDERRQCTQAMRITIVTVGSRGDVQPYVALGVGFQAAGHQVRLATHDDFQSFIEEHGLGFAPLPGDPRTLLETTEGRQLLESGGNPFRLLKQFVRLAEPLAHKCLSDGLQACQGSDAIIFSTPGCFGYWIAQQMGVPSCAAYYAPMTPSWHMPSPVFPPVWSSLPLSGLYNRVTFSLGGGLLWAPLAGAVNRARRAVLGLPPLSMWSPPWRNLAPGHLYLYGYSATVLPKPPDWGEAEYVTGYWFLRRTRDWEPPHKLVDFLESGPPPVCIGFGSMNNRNAAEVTDVVVKALLKARQRGILMTGWGGLADAHLPDEILPIESVPHDWLFPRVAAVVHHGGAGTTAAGLRAGVPAVIVPFMSDQPMWARRVLKLRVSPQPIPRRKLTVARLAEALEQAVNDLDMRARARDLGRIIRAEDGVGKAVAAFHAHLGIERPRQRADLEPVTAHLPPEPNEQR